MNRPCSRLVFRLGGSLLFVWLLAACGSRNEDAAPPPAVENATTSLGGFVWQDLLTDNLDASVAFYGALLGWEFEESARFGVRYVLVRTVLGYIGGMIEVERRDPATPVAQWLSYLLATNVADTVDRARQLGGHVVIEPYDFAGGQIAVVADPQGALFALTSRELGLPNRDPRVAPRGTFFWRDYFSADVNSSVLFYGTVGEFDAEPQRRSDDLPHYVLRDAREIGGVVPLPVAQRHVVNPNWLPYVRVADPLRLVRQAEALGGQILLQPQPDVHGGSLGIISDPQGAAIALQRYPR